MVKKRIKTCMERIYLFFIFIFLYAPIVTLIGLSFNANKTRGKWGGFSLKWYHRLFQDQTILHALFTTLILALLSALIATILGTAVSFAINQMKKLPKTILMSVTNIPMLNADIVTGISLMLMFIAIRYTMGFSSVLLAHITFNLPFVILSVMPRLRQLNISAYEAAMDLGASKRYAFIKVILPDIMPSVMTGFLLSFTMSLDDFVITHFTKGIGVDTLSTLIYTEQKKGIRPEIYALSTILFVAVLILVMLYNREKNTEAKKEALPLRRLASLGRIVGYISIPVVFALVVTGYYRTGATGTAQLKVYNWGEYMDPEVIKDFEEETGIEVIYDEFETNETMYPIVSKGAVQYDLVCPSDYMIQRMEQEGLLEEVDWDNVPNRTCIDDEFWQFARSYDENNRYSVPYLWGTVGILYNKKMVKEPIDSWGVLWDTKYKDNVLMQKSVRDAFGVTLKYLGYSLNTTDENELEEAKNKLIEQKKSGVVQAYVVDEVRDKMIAGEAAIGVIYSGEALTCQESNENLEYVVPKEGSNLWMDSWVIPKGAENKENAERFLNFLCRPEIMKKNFDFITYSVPSTEARKILDEEYRDNEIVFPDMKSLTNCEVFKYLGSQADQRYNDKWKDVMAR